MKLTAQSPAALVLKHKALDWIGNRKRIDFWLFVDKIYDLEVYAIIDWLKKKGLFRSYAMTGLRVMFAYHHNNIEAILDELPDLKELLGQGNCGETQEMLKEILENQRKLLELGITDTKLPPSPIAAQPATTGRPLTSKQLAAPSFAEDEDDVLPIATKAAQSNSSMNFVNALQNLH